jgi:hypothetical protein
MIRRPICATVARKSVKQSWSERARCLAWAALLVLSACGDDAGATSLDASDASDASATDGSAVSSPASCQEPLITDPQDACLTCALEYCCVTGEAHLAGRCLSPFAAEREDERSYCYDSAFTGCIVGCFEQRQPVTPETSSWDVVAACVDFCEDDDGGGVDRGGIDAGGIDAGSTASTFPRNSSREGQLTECIIGSTRDAPVVSDAAPRSYACESNAICYPRTPCAELCFAGWR